MEIVWEAINPFVADLAKEIITAVVSLLLLFWGVAKTKIIAHIKNDQIRKAAAEGFALAEKRFTQLSGEGKFNQAFVYTSKKLGDAKIKVTPEEIKAAIEKAVVDYNWNKNKAS